MIVYNATIKEFNNDVIKNEISDKIYKKLNEFNIHGISTAEYHSWQNSLNFMKNVLDDRDLDEEIEVAIEFQIPKTSKRVDFMIAGTNEDGKSNIIIVELKQWERAEKIDDQMLHSVKTFTGGSNRIVSHPSYQAYSYAVLLKTLVNKSKMKI